MIYLFFALIFILLQGFYAGMETGMVSVMRPRAEHAVRSTGGSNAKIILFFVTHPSVMIATTLIGVNISVVCASLSAKKFMETCGLHGGVGILISTGILSVILLSCEIIPKNWFRQAPYKRCSRFAWLLYATYILLFIPVRMFAAFTGFLTSAFSKNKDNTTSHAVIREDFRLFLRESEDSGSVDSETAEILDNAMNLPASRMGDIMTMKKDADEIPSSMTIREAFDYACEHNAEKLPVYISDVNSEKHEWRAIFSIYDAIYTVDESLWDTMKVTACLTQIRSLKESGLITDALELTRKHKVKLFVVTSDDGEQLGLVSPEKIASMLFE